MATKSDVGARFFDLALALEERTRASMALSKDIRELCMLLRQSSRTQAMQLAAPTAKTRRDYNYFVELEARLAKLCTEMPPVGDEPEASRPWWPS